MRSSAWLTRGIVDSALRRASVWEVGNRALYDLCAKHPGHVTDEEIAAKIWLIGRSYAASIERRRGNDGVEVDDFYRDVVVPEMKRARVDRWFQPLRDLRRPGSAAVVPVHKRLTDLFGSISGLQKRSLASKYLHFHFPRAVYLFDERASRGVRDVAPAGRERKLPFDACDETYARFYLRCERFHQELEALTGRAMTPREVDSVLLAVAERD